MIIDAHAHLGKIWDKNYGIDSLDKFIKEPITRVHFCQRGVRGEGAELFSVLY